MKKSIFRTLLLNFARDNKALLFVILISGLVSGIFTVVLPVSVGRFFELLLGISSTKSKALNFLPSAWTASISHFLIFMVVVIIIKFVAQFIFGFRQKKFTENFLANLKNRLFSKQLRVDPQVYEKSGMNKYLLRYSGDFISIRTWLNQGVLGFFTDLIIVLLAILTLLYIEWKASVLLLLSFGISSLGLYFISKQIMKLSRIKRNKLSGQLGFTASTFSGLNTIHAYNTDYQNKKKYYQRTDAILGQSLSLFYFEALNKAFVAFMQYFILMLIFIYFWKSYSPDELRQHGGNIISFILLYLTIIPFFGRLLKTPALKQKANISIDKLVQIFELPVVYKKEGEELITHNPRIEFKDFSIQGSTPFDFTSAKGGVKQLELPHGVDFYKLSKCLIKLSSVYDGQITINQQDIQKFSPKSLRSTISIVSTRYRLMGKTLMEAMLSGSNSKKELSTLWQDLHQQLHIEEILPLHNKIGERGENLTALQYEVACLTRGLLHNGNIILVDRLPHIEKYNLKALKEILQNGKTVVMVRNAPALIPNSEA